MLLLLLLRVVPPPIFLGVTSGHSGLPSSPFPDPVSCY